MHENRYTTSPLHCSEMHCPLKTGPVSHLYMYLSSECEAEWRQTLSNLALIDYPPCTKQTYVKLCQEKDHTLKWPGGAFPVQSIGGFLWRLIATLSASVTLKTPPTMSHILQVWRNKFAILTVILCNYPRRIHHTVNFRQQCINKFWWNLASCMWQSTWG